MRVFSNGTIFSGGKLIRISLLLCVIFSAGSFAWGYHLAGYANVVNWIIVFGVAWIAAVGFKWKWFPSGAVLAALGLAAFGVWFEFGGGWMFNGAVFALFAWNLSEFERKLKFLPAREREDMAGRSRRHLLRISLLLIFGFAIEALFLLLRNQFSAQWGWFVLGVILVGSLQALAWRRY